MKSLKFIFLTLLAISFCLAGKAQGSNILVNRLNDKLEKHQYFELRKIYQENERRLPSAYSLYFSANIDAAFNAPEESNRKILELIKLTTGELTPIQMVKILSVKLQNHIHLYEYKEAWQTCQFITATYKDVLTEEELSNYENNLKVWEALTSTDKQEISQEEDVTVDLKRDQSGLYRIGTDFISGQESMVFDTGANFSVMQRSLAEKLGLDIIDVNFQTMSATGIKVNSDLAIAPEIHIGGISLKNVVFIVFDDEALQFPSIDYEIEGIIGFPVIRAMEELHFGMDNKLRVPLKKSKYSYDNFALDGLMPAVEVACNGEKLPFYFDTGADQTYLLPRYYQRHRAELDKKYDIMMFNAGSAGGQQSYHGMNIKKLTLQVGESKAKMKDVILKLEENQLQNNFYGNIGQDFISQFSSYVISFKSSSIFFE